MTTPAANATAKTESHPGRVVVVIDHHAARLFQEPPGTAGEKETTVKPDDPHGFHRHLIHRKEAHYKGERAPEDTAFYEQIAKGLASAKEIILIGHGTGKSNAAVFLAEYLKTHHSTVHQRITATETADLSAMTEPQMEQVAKKHI
jgi:DNA-binding MurR/RpiR family transcriptional regulator